MYWGIFSKKLFYSPAGPMRTNRTKENIFLGSCPQKLLTDWLSGHETCAVCRNTTQRHSARFRVPARTGRRACVRALYAPRTSNTSALAPHRDTLRCSLNSLSSAYNCHVSVTCCYRVITFLTNVAVSRVTSLLVPRWNTCVVGHIWTLLTCFTVPSFRFFALFPEDGWRKVQDTRNRSYASSKPPSAGSCNVRNATESWRKGKARVTDAETRKLYVFKNEIASHLRRLPSKMN